MLSKYSDISIVNLSPCPVRRIILSSEVTESNQTTARFRRWLLRPPKYHIIRSVYAAVKK
ncbi:hypothetical protein I7I53_08644 [Histoplasma capsulatum var. duboisii H88]|uniref:Uncharacterized protein n=1 Tax=Ajellomyces capsulatus (strain H88) TaxID=544711 RepID=A0A8A1LJR3_AJEC8|nr:hypothetical protein I7I53_08644 [Histoplasma capsulatum var. duboisii H88]